MTEQVMRAIIDHPKRKLIVIILTLVMLVMLGLPAVEEYIGARTRRADAREKLHEASGAAANLPKLREELERIQRGLQELEQKTVTRQDVESLRDGELQKLIRESGCQMREVQIDDVPTRREWMSNDSPLHGPPAGNPGQATPFELTQWNARIRIEGPADGVYKFLERINQMDRLVHTKLVELQRSRSDENLTQLRMEFTLFDLGRKTSRIGR